jgi:predicted nuclease of restriction endonuclease-like (RecB) superfamily
VNYSELLGTLGEVHAVALRGTARIVNQFHILRNWAVGCLIFEFEQHGEDRAAYGEGLLKRLCADLAANGMTGLGLSTLKGCRTFYRTYPQIGQAATGQFQDLLPQLQISQSVIGLSPTACSQAQERLAVTPTDPTPLPSNILLGLSWTHFLELIRLDDPWKRAFYENECLKGGWAVRQLQRQIGSLLYERTGMSSDKQTVIEAGRNQAAECPNSIHDLIRDPYILEFTGLSGKAAYLERDLETLLLDHLQSFLLELGTGFCFEARQKRITVGNEHDYIDLVFYHRRPRPPAIRLPLPQQPSIHRKPAKPHRTRYRHLASGPRRSRRIQSHSHMNNFIPLPGCRHDILGHHLKASGILRAIHQCASVSENLEDEDADFRSDWLALSAAGLARAYGDDEPEYDTGMIKEPNPEYRARA